MYGSSGRGVIHRFRIGAAPDRFMCPDQDSLVVMHVGRKGANGAGADYIRSIWRGDNFDIGDLNPVASRARLKGS